VTTCTIIIGVGGGDLPEVSGVPEGWTVILRDYESGNVPDENGDLYEDTVLVAGTERGRMTHRCGSCGTGTQHIEGRCRTCGGPFSPRPVDEPTWKGGRSGYFDQDQDAREMIVTALRRYATVGGDVGAEAAALARRIDNPTEVQR
jgi:hypothetical protein